MLTPLVLLLLHHVVEGYLVFGDRVCSFKLPKISKRVQIVSWVVNEPPFLELILQRVQILMIVRLHFGVSLDALWMIHLWLIVHRLPKFGRICVLERRVVVRLGLMERSSRFNVDVLRVLLVYLFQLLYFLDARSDLHRCHSLAFSRCKELVWVRISCCKVILGNIISLEWFQLLVQFWWTVLLDIDIWVQSLQMNDSRVLIVSARSLWCAMLLDLVKIHLLNLCGNAVVFLIPQFLRPEWIQSVRPRELLMSGVHHCCTRT